MLKVHATVEVQLAACICSIIASSSYLKLRNLTLTYYRMNCFSVEVTFSLYMN